MTRSNSSTSTKLIIAIVLSFAFFVAELIGETNWMSILNHVFRLLIILAVGFRTKSLALIADAFHYVYHACLVSFVTAN